MHPFLKRKSLQAFLSLLDNRFECVDVGNCEFAEHFSVDLNALRIQSVDQLAVLDAAFATCSRNTSDPKASKVSLLSASVTEGILPRFHDLFVSSLKDVLLTSEIALGFSDDLLVALVAHKATFNSCHVFSLFLVVHRVPA